MTIMPQLLFDLDVKKYGPWIETWKSDPDCRELADRHYTRRKDKIGVAQFTRPGDNLVLRTLDGTAVWCSWKSQFRKDGFEAIESSIFRNENPRRLSSLLIKWAIFATLEKWGSELPRDGIITYVNDDAVSSQNKGYCYIKAGFRRIGRSKSRGLTVLQLTSDACELVMQEMSLVSELEITKYMIKLALRSGEHYEAFEFQQDAIDLDRRLREMKREMRRNKLQAWSDYRRPQRNEDFVERLYDWIPEEYKELCHESLGTME